MAKNIVVFSDGTGQDGGARPEQRRSNVYKLHKACCVGAESPIDPNQQVAFYDPGLGTDIGATALTAPVRFVQKLLASVEGRGITRNIADCYEFIINHYESGDRIYLIGFSRCAYTVRCVANLLMLCGIPMTTPDGPVMKFRMATRQIAESLRLSWSTEPATRGRNSRPSAMNSHDVSVRSTGLIFQEGRRDGQTRLRISLECSTRSPLWERLACDESSLKQDLRLAPASGRRWLPRCLRLSWRGWPTGDWTGPLVGRCSR